MVSFLFNFYFNILRSFHSLSKLCFILHFDTHIVMVSDQDHWLDIGHHNFWTDHHWAFIQVLLNSVWKMLSNDTKALLSLKIFDFLYILLYFSQFWWSFLNKNHYEFKSRTYLETLNTLYNKKNFQCFLLTISWK